MLLVKGFNKFVNATKENNSLEITKDFRFITSLTISLFLGFISVCRFKSQPYYRHLAATPSFGRADSWGVAFRRRQLSALQTMELPLDGDKYDSLLIFTVTGILRSVEWEIKDKQKQAALPDLNIVKRPKNVWNNQIQEQDFFYGTKRPN